jgi:hypothetical protein
MPLAAAPRRCDRDGSSQRAAWWTAGGHLRRDEGLLGRRCWRE